MASLPMNEDMINNLANDIAKTYMSGQVNLNLEDFVDLYLKVYDVSKKKIVLNNKRGEVQDFSSTENIQGHLHIR